MHAENLKGPNVEGISIIFVSSLFRAGEEKRTHEQQQPPRSFIVNEYPNSLLRARPLSL